jgi:hypothetical protein
MRRSLRALALLTVLTAGALAATTPANGAIHEMVAAYCSGGDHGAIDAAGFLEPPGISDPSEQNFAQPVRSNGVVEFPLITDAPAAKFPEGTNVLTLDVSQADHPSAEHCKALNP